MNNSFDERRKHQRIYRNFILSYYEKGQLSIGNYVSQVNNVSKGGVNFSSTHPIKEGAMVTVDLRTPFISDAMHLEGVVLACKEKIPGMIYEIRLQFQEVPQEILSVLDKIETYSKSMEG